MTHPEIAMDRLPAVVPRTYTCPHEKGDDTPKVGLLKPLCTVTVEAGELRIRPNSWSDGKATCRYQFVRLTINSSAMEPLFEKCKQTMV